jgi:hypothetical protein
MNTSDFSAYCQLCSSVISVKKTELLRFLNNNEIVLCSSCKAGQKNKNPNAMSSRNSWYGMKRRCNCPNQNGYERYGGRGITYDPKWETFEGFYADMGDRPGPGYDLDRIDNNGNYCKENCRWVTHLENCKNRGGRRPTRLYTFNGKTLCISDWAKELGLTPQSLQKRLNNGWPLELALSSEKRDKDPSKKVIRNDPPTKGKKVRRATSKYITVDGVTKTYSEWELEKGLSKGLISKRLSQGCTPYEAVMNVVKKQ